MTGHGEERAQLTRMTVSNYRSAGEDVSIDLEPITVLVGVNGSGKSNLLDAPRFVAQALTDGLESAVEERHGFDSMLRDVGRARGTMRIRLELEHPDWTADYLVELGSPARHRDDFGIRREELVVRELATRQTNTLTKNQLGNVSSTWSGLAAPVRDRRNLALLAVGGDARLEPVVTALRAVETYALFPERLREPQAPNPRAYLSKFGDNWTSIVRRVMSSASALDLRLALDRVTGDIIDLRAQRLGAGFLVGEFGHARPSGRPQWFEAARESDGTLRVAGILTALVQQPPLLMIGIEEPEQTVHAGVLPILADFLRATSETSRVVVTTHSPDLLDLVPVAGIRVVERIDGTTRVARLDEGQQELVRRRLESPGGLLRTQGLVAQEP
ncbi:MAG: AAA family ATPase [Acidimicrobiales bacterium]